MEKIKKIKRGTLPVLLTALIIFLSQPLSAHCDSYDGPLIKDALKALETSNISPVLKWIDEKYEPEITALFNKTVSLRGGDKEVYAIVEKHFLETLVRLHREGEGAPYTGLKPAGSASPIIVMADQAIASGEVNTLTTKLDSHLNKVLADKYNEVMEKSLKKDNSTAEGREYVKAYIEYTHFLEAIHGIIEGGASHEGH
jgi:hypothetical protein